MANTCPHCNMLLTTKERTAKRCPVCKRGLRAGGRAGSSDVSKIAPAMSVVRTAPESSTHPIAGFFTIMGFVILGVIVTIAMSGGKTDWIWIGCGVGAGVGVAVAQAAGFYRRR